MHPLMLCPYVEPTFLVEVLSITYLHKQQPCMNNSLNIINNNELTKIYVKLNEPSDTSTSYDNISSPRNSFIKKYY